MGRKLEIYLPAQAAERLGNCAFNCRRVVFVLLAPVTRDLLHEALLLFRHLLAPPGGMASRRMIGVVLTLRKVYRQDGPAPRFAASC